MPTALTVYEFRDSPFASAGDTRVCVADKGVVEGALGLDRLAALFRGVAVYADDTGRSYVGVWGARSGPRLRRLLREHGVALAIERSRPPGLRLRHFTTRPRRRRP